MAPKPPFGETFVVQPKAQHTHTAIMIHGRGSNGKEFAEEFFEAQLSDGSIFTDKFPGWKWVFPSSQTLWSTAFEEEMPAWFEAHSLTDVTARQDLQISGIKDSVNHLSDVVEQEVESLGGDTGRVVMMGISQGAAIGLWTFLSSKATAAKIEAFVGASSWLPFANDLKSRLSPGSHSPSDRDLAKKSNGQDFVEMMVAAPSEAEASEVARFGSLHNIPVFLGHGTDDAYVDVELGRQARNVLSCIGLNVEWKEYKGAEQEGHWLKEPEETNDIFHFLQRVVMKAKTA